MKDISLLELLHGKNWKPASQYYPLSKMNVIVLCGADNLGLQSSCHFGSYNSFHGSIFGQDTSNTCPSTHETRGTHE